MYLLWGAFDSIRLAASSLLLRLRIQVQATKVEPVSVTGIRTVRLLQDWRMPTARSICC